MNYSALIENRKSVREFSDKQVFFGDLDKLREYYSTSVRRLAPGLKTELRFFGKDIQAALEGAAGYSQFLVGAPHYMVLLSEKHDLAYLNGGYIMEDLILKLTDMDLSSCWLTFTGSDAVKKAIGIDSKLDIVVIVAFGYGKKTVKRLRLNIFSMSNVDLVAKHRYMEPKKSVNEIAFLNTWGNTRNLDAYIGFFDDMLWEALYAASLSPSYLNRQAYGFLLHDDGISLVAAPDAYNTRIDGQLSLGIVLHHFTSVAQSWAGKIQWRFGEAAGKLELPEGHTLIATTSL